MKQSVNGWGRIVLSWVAVAVALTAALGLAACGRKGPLDPPPSAALTQPAPPAARPGLGEEHYGTPPGAPPPTAAAAPAPQQKSFFLDFLIGK